MKIAAGLVLMAAVTSADDRPIDRPNTHIERLQNELAIARMMAVQCQHTYPFRAFRQPGDQRAGDGIQI